MGIVVRYQKVLIPEFGIETRYRKVSIPEKGIDTQHYWLLNQTSKSLDLAYLCYRYLGYEPFCVSEVKTTNFDSMQCDDVTSS